MKISQYYDLCRGQCISVTIAEQMFRREKDRSMADETNISKAELLANMQRGWDELEACIDALSEAQLTGPTDAAGWTVKDHLMHLAVWADGVTAMLDGGARRESMGLDEETWASRDFDRMNAVIQQAHKDKPLDEVLTALRAAHQALYSKAQSMSDDDLRRPYNYFDPTSPQDRPIIGWIIGDSYGHYEEHLPWMKAIAR
jgi:uncharacterized protein (TIGR03083 family)